MSQANSEPVVNGNDSAPDWYFFSITLIKIQIPNQTTCTHTNVMLPQKFAIARRLGRTGCVPRWRLPRVPGSLQHFAESTDRRNKLSQSPGFRCVLTVQAHAPSAGVMQWLR